MPANRDDRLERVEFLLERVDTAFQRMWSSLDHLGETVDRLTPRPPDRLDRELAELRRLAGRPDGPALTLIKGGDDAS